MRNSKLVFAICLYFGASSIAFCAGGFSNAKINRVRSHSTGFTYFGISKPLSDVCSNYGDSFKFDHRTDTGKAFLSTILAAKAAQTSIDGWYYSSTAPGTNESTGCTDTTLSVLTGVGLSQ